MFSHLSLQFKDMLFHILTCIETEEGSSQLIFLFKQLERRKPEKIRVSTGFEPVACDALPTEL